MCCWQHRAVHLSEKAAGEGGAAPQHFPSSECQGEQTSPWTHRNFKEERRSREDKASVQAFIIWCQIWIWGGFLKHIQLSFPFSQQGIRGFPSGFHVLLCSHLGHRTLLCSITEESRVNNKNNTLFFFFFQRNKEKRNLIVEMTPCLQHDSTFSWNKYRGESACS